MLVDFDDIIENNENKKVDTKNKNKKVDAAHTSQLSKEIDNYNKRNESIEQESVTTSEMGLVSATPPSK